MESIQEGVEKAYEDIRSMKVRGALTLAMHATEALREVVESSGGTTQEIISELAKSGEKLRDARPTAVSLPNAIDYVNYLADKNRGKEAEEFRKAMSEGITKFVKAQWDGKKKIAEIGAGLIEDGDDILTHCNSDTAISIIKRAWDDGKKINVVCTESRPRYQGHLTAAALADHGIPVTMIVDSAVHFMMQRLDIDKVVVGADTVYSNGDVLNKIGTSGIAACAHNMEIEFIVATNALKFSLGSLMGRLSEIEERDSKEVAELNDSRIKIANPAFDITSAKHINSLVTEHGVIPPGSVYQFIRDNFKWRFEDDGYQ